MFTIPVEIIDQGQNESGKGYSVKAKLDVSEKLYNDLPIEETRVSAIRNNRFPLSEITFSKKNGKIIEIQYVFRKKVNISFSEIDSKRFELTINDFNFFEIIPELSSMRTQKNNVAALQSVEIENIDIIGETNITDSISGDDAFSLEYSHLLGYGSEKNTDKLIVDQTNIRIKYSKLFYHGHRFKFDSALRYFAKNDENVRLSNDNYRVEKYIKSAVYQYSNRYFSVQLGRQVIPLGYSEFAAVNDKLTPKYLRNITVVDLDQYYLGQDALNIKIFREPFVLGFHYVVNPKLSVQPSAVENFTAQLGVRRSELANAEEYGLNIKYSSEYYDIYALAAKLHSNEVSSENETVGDERSIYPDHITTGVGLSVPYGSSVFYLDYSNNFNTWNNKKIGGIYSNTEVAFQEYVLGLTFDVRRYSIVMEFYEKAENVNSEKIMFLSTGKEWLRGNLSVQLVASKRLESDEYLFNIDARYKLNDYFSLFTTSSLFGFDNGSLMEDLLGREDRIYVGFSLFL